MKEDCIMELILKGGDARSKAIEAMRKLKDEDFESAKELMKECNDYIVEAHKVQSKLLQQEASGAKMEVQLLMVHAQDHLMDAMVIRDVVENLIEIQEKTISKINKL